LSPKVREDKTGRRVVAVEAGQSRSSILRRRGRTAKMWPPLAPGMRSIRCVGDLLSMTGRDVGKIRLVDVMDGVSRKRFADREAWAKAPLSRLRSSGPFVSSRYAGRRASSSAAEAGRLHDPARGGLRAPFEAFQEIFLLQIPCRCAPLAPASMTGPRCSARRSRPPLPWNVARGNRFEAGRSEKNIARTRSSSTENKGGAPRRGDRSGPRSWLARDVDREQCAAGLASRARPTIVRCEFHRARGPAFFRVVLPRQGNVPDAGSGLGDSDGDIALCFAALYWPREFGAWNRVDVPLGEGKADTDGEEGPLEAMRPIQLSVQRGGKLGE